MNKIFLTITLLITIALPAYGETPEEKGLRIMTEVEVRDSGYKDMTAKMEMTLTNRHGQKSVREMFIKNFEVKGDGDKGMSIFKNPKDIKGTALLTFSHKVGLDDQWLYLPALKRVKRISSANKSGSFMGSEFAFEDIASQEVEKYTYKYLKEDKVGETEVFVVEAYPVDKNSGYTRQLIHVDEKRYIPVKIDYYDRKDSFLKTLIYSEYNQYIDKFWRPNKMFMKNHQTGKTTTLVWTDYKFQTGLTDKDFTKNALKRAR